MRTALCLVALLTVGCDGGPSAPSRVFQPIPPGPPAQAPTLAFDDCVTVPGTPPKDPALVCDLVFTPAR